MSSTSQLHHTLVTAPGQTPRGWILWLHGMLGQGSNWRSLARKLVAARPELGAVLVDLRLHGGSQEMASPHTVDAAARDLVTLTEALAAGGRPVTGVIGHSFGGKVALALRAMSPPPALRDTWVLDSSPSANPDPRPSDDPDGVARVLALLETVPREAADRASFVANLRGAGLSQAISDWLAMNLEHRQGHMYFPLDLTGLGELLADYFRQDLWHAFDDALPGAAHVVAAGRSTSVTEDDRQRLSALHQAGTVDFHIIERAGHWIHVDAPEEILRLLTVGLAPP